MECILVTHWNQENGKTESKLGETQFVVYFRPTHKAVSALRQSAQTPNGQSTRSRIRMQINLAALRACDARYI